MWEHEYSVETSASRGRDLGALGRCGGVAAWNDGIEKLEIHGPFAVGTTFTMTPPGDDPVHMSLTEIRPGELFTDEADGGDFVVRTIHKLEPADDGRTRIVYRTEITGPAAAEIGPQIGPEITADFPEVLAALAKLAEGAEG